MRSVAAVAATLAVAVFLAACGSSPMKNTGTATTRRAPTTTEAPPTTAANTTTSVPATTTTSPRTVRYLPLFPFGDFHEAVAWQQGYGREHQQERFDAGATALAFARFLGYGEINRVVSVADDAKGAHVGVGFVSEGNHLTTAAVVHLVRFGSGAHRPWEVVATDDTDFTIDVPAYGAVIASPATVGGRITGVDESIAVHVQQLHTNGNLGEQCCTAAGGMNSPWTATVAFQPPTDAVLIVSAATGGHLREVERFAVTGVKRSSG